MTVHTLRKVLMKNYLVCVLARLYTYCCLNMIMFEIMTCYIIIMRNVAGICESGFSGSQNSQV